jgi:2-isopropylmalate synthase
VSAPIWCSVDQRDGNQALINPLDGARKGTLFDALVGIGFKEIEVGCLAASAAEFEFCRTLIDEHLIPEDVTVQVLVPARKPLIETTFKALEGAKRAIIHLCNSTSEVQREVVFRSTGEGVLALPVRAARSGAGVCRAVPEHRVAVPVLDREFHGHRTRLRP